MESTNKENLNLEAVKSEAAKLETTKSSAESSAASSFAKKGFLLDKESLDFLMKLENNSVTEELLNKIFLITRSRLISKKIINEHFAEIKECLAHAGKEKDRLIQDFFKSATVVKIEEKKPAEIIEKKPFPNIKILSSNITPYRKIEVKDFITHFKNRYNFFKDCLKEKKELENPVSINKISGNRNFSIIGLVSSKRITKNKNLMLEVEDLTGRISILVSQDKENVMKKAKEILLDDVIGIKCSGSGDFIYANDIVFLDCGTPEKKKADEEAYALFISDMHIGSKLFLKQNFERFINWLNGQDADEKTKDKISKIKYLFVVGDNVDGVGVYPGQEQLLEIKDVRDQYALLAEYLRKIPSHIKIVLCAGQHDAVRVPEPQPALDAEFAKEITEMSNVYLVSNPALIEMNCCEKKAGFKVLIYHGASMHSWIDEIEDLRQGQANLNPSKVVKYLLKHRHLSPMHSGNVYVPGENEDSLVIKEIPDIIVTADLHRTDVDLYNNILIICCSCWQSITPFEEKVGNQPDPCKVPMLNLKTREIKILDFS